MPTVHLLEEWQKERRKDRGAKMIFSPCSDSFNYSSKTPSSKSLYLLSTASPSHPLTWSVSHQHHKIMISAIPVPSSNWKIVSNYPQQHSKYRYQRALAFKEPIISWVVLFYQHFYDLFYSDNVSASEDCRIFQKIRLFV